MNHRGAHQPNQLRLLFWETTVGCNLKCMHCRASAEPGRSPEELTTAEAMAFVDDLVSFANPILILSGGEPLYRPDILDIAAYAKLKGLRVALATCLVVPVMFGATFWFQGRMLRAFRRRLRRWWISVWT